MMSQVTLRLIHYIDFQNDGGSDLCFHVSITWKKSPTVGQRFRVDKPHVDEIRGVSPPLFRYPTNSTSYDRRPSAANRSQ